MKFIVCSAFNQCTVLMLLSMANNAQGIIVTFQHSKNFMNTNTCKHFAETHADSFCDFYDALMNFIVMIFNFKPPAI